MCIPFPFLRSEQSIFVSIGNPKSLVELDFDEMTLVTKALQEVKSNECEGGVEGGVSNSSDDESVSAHEEVSETREGVREILEKGIFCSEGARGVGGRVGNGEVCDRDATLRTMETFFLRSGRVHFDPGMSDVPVVDEAWEGGTYWTVDSDDVAQPIGVPPVPVALVTCETGLCRVALFEAGGKTGGLAAGIDTGSEMGTLVALVWRFGSAAILRLRGAAIDFAAFEIGFVFGDCGCGDESDTPAMIGDKSGERGSGLLGLGAQTYLRFSWALRSTSEVVTDIRPKLTTNEGMSTLRSADCFIFSVDVVKRN